MRREHMSHVVLEYYRTKLPQLVEKGGEVFFYGDDSVGFVKTLLHAEYGYLPRRYQDVREVSVAACDGYSTMLRMVQRKIRSRVKPNIKPITDERFYNPYVICVLFSNGNEYDVVDGFHRLNSVTNYTKGFVIILHSKKRFQ